jgi:endonuclease/exonuclease/phosphatase (EEP) superfamily protein YafD
MATLRLRKLFLTGSSGMCRIRVDDLTRHCGYNLDDMTTTTPIAAARSNSKRSLFARSLLTLTWLGMLCGYLGRFHWLLDLANHFVVHYLAVCVVCGVWSGVRRQWKWLGFSIVTALLLIIRIVPYYVAERGEVAVREVQASQAGIRLVSLNLLTSNPHKKAVLQFLEQSDADLLLLMELDRLWQQELIALQQRYPFGGLYPREDNFGIGLLSRLPITELELQAFDGTRIPSITGIVDWSGHRLQFIGTHPLPPTNASNAAHRDQHFQQLARFVQQSELPTVVAGDLNCTSWSVHFNDLLAQSRLRDSRLGKGIQPSWPASLVIGGIPIDHVLVSKGIQIGSRRLGPDVGSDHLPVIVQLAPSQVPPSSNQ